MSSPRPWKMTRYFSIAFRLVGSHAERPWYESGPRPRVISGFVSTHHCSHVCTSPEAVSEQGCRERWGVLDKLCTSGDGGTHVRLMESTLLEVMV